VKTQPPATPYRVIKITSDDDRYVYHLRRVNDNHPWAPRTLTYHRDRRDCLTLDQVVNLLLVEEDYT